MKVKGIASLAAGAAMLACSGMASAETVLQYVPQSDLKILDPHVTTATITRTHAYMVYDMLFAVGNDMKPYPQMVGDWSVTDDGLLYSFTLRNGLKFHDGQPVTSADVIASLKRWGQKNAMGQMMLKRLDKMEAVDDKTFTIKLTESMPFLLMALGTPADQIAAIMRKEDAEKDPDMALKTAIGSGPYKFVPEEWVPGSKVVYVKNEDYVPRDEPSVGATGGKVVKVDKVIWNVISDPQTAQAALVNGEVDLLSNPSPDFIKILQADPNIVVKSIQTLDNQGVFRINHLHPPFNNVYVRRAMQQLVDQHIFLQAMIGDPDLYSLCPSMFVCGSIYSNDANSSWYDNQNIPKAKELLKQGGYHGEPVYVLYPADFQPYATAAQVIGQVLRDGGMNVELLTMDWATLTKRRTQKDVPSKDRGWHIFPTGSSGYTMSSPITSTHFAANGDKAYPGWPDNPEYEALREKFTRVSGKEQLEVARQIQEMANDFVLYVYTGQWTTLSAWRSNISGVLQSPSAGDLLWNIEKK